MNLGDRDKVLDEVREALGLIDGAAVMYIPRVDEQQTLLFLADVVEVVERLRHSPEAEGASGESGELPAQDDGYGTGYNDALSAAVSMVAALPCKCDAGKDYCDGHTDAIVAIEGLRAAL